ncbi:hypothetical protein O9K51_00704 [Purpureocillium lavendulum]|uniref:Uncharacterized protein n=1 Tax=Purpureocillium lavendulum TaxID=1247861 RepID=A0AB34G478_9HYPO|nr:hypothetical protein O9K51_00704 [Purpureocillium lavendulum]
MAPNGPLNQAISPSNNAGGTCECHPRTLEVLQNVLGGSATPRESANRLDAHIHETARQLARRCNNFEPRDIALYATAEICAVMATVLAVSSAHPATHAVQAAIFDVLSEIHNASLPFYSYCKPPKLALNEGHACLWLIDHSEAHNLAITLQQMLSGKWSPVPPFVLFSTPESLKLKGLEETKRDLVRNSLNSEAGQRAGRQWGHLQWFLASLATRRLLTCGEASALHHLVPSLGSMANLGADDPSWASWIELDIKGVSGWLMPDRAREHVYELCKRGGHLAWDLVAWAQWKRRLSIIAQDARLTAEHRQEAATMWQKMAGQEKAQGTQA